MDRQQTESILTAELSKMFKRENLQNNKYMISRMNNNLEISLETVFNERFIVQPLTSDKEIILSALEKVDNITIIKEQSILKPKIQALKNRIIIKNIKKQQNEQFEQFIKESIQNKKYTSYFDKNNLFRVIFEAEEDAEQFYNWITNHEFDGKKVEVVFEKENVYLTFLSKMKEKINNKQPPNYQNQTQNQPSMPYGQMPYGFEYYKMMPQMMNYPFNYFNQYNYYPNYSPNFFIRKSKDAPDFSYEPPYYESVWKKETAVEQTVQKKNQSNDNQYSVEKKQQRQSLPQQIRLAISQKKIVETFKNLNLNNKIEMHQNLSTLDETKIPILEKNNFQSLECIEPTRKYSNVEKK